MVWWSRRKAVSSPTAEALAQCSHKSRGFGEKDCRRDGASGQEERRPPIAAGFSRSGGLGVSLREIGNLVIKYHG
jgi:hypothetical protein